MSQFLGNWDFDQLQEADQGIFGDDESDLSEPPSPTSSMDIDLDPFKSDDKSDSEHVLDPNRFSVQFLLPLEVRYP
jgi:hypothetical protein